MRRFTHTIIIINTHNQSLFICTVVVTLVTNHGILLNMFSSLCGFCVKLSGITDTFLYFLKLMMSYHRPKINERWAEHVYTMSLLK